ncbi:nucleotidyltransferase domain-containing protein, partial [Streptomyces sp. S9]|nr:nucleotidyltransferase domain-containing protein [Streptomyces sp. S9]
MPAPEHSDADFLADTADALAALPTVRAVALGGSRAQGTHRADSDRDLAVYYRGAWQPAVYPPRLRRAAPERWHGTARATLA